MKLNALRCSLAVGAMALALGLSACSADNEASPSDAASDGGTAATTTASTTPANAQKVKVSLVEMAINTTPSSAKAGNVAFDISNDGAVTHEMVVVKTKTKAADLPTDSAGKASETGSVGETEVEPGASDVLDLKLAKGHYALICNLPGHYAAGMYSDFTVK